MDMNENQMLAGVRKNWAIILFIGGLIIGWTSVQQRLDVLERSSEEHKQEMKEINIQVTKINNDFGNAIVEIKANYLFIKDKLQKLEDK